MMINEQCIVPYGTTDLLFFINSTDLLFLTEQKNKIQIFSK